jgi:hypothetical protein
MDWTARAREKSWQCDHQLDRSCEGMCDRCAAALAAEAYQKGKQMGIAEGFKVEVMDVTGDAAMMAEVGRLKADVAALTAALTRHHEWPNATMNDRCVICGLDAAAGGA